MKITFLGTADVRPRVDAYVSATMIEVGDRVYLLDAGAPVSDLMLRYGRRPDALCAVFTTHAHNDHVDGLFQLFSQAFGIGTVLDQSPPLQFFNKVHVIFLLSDA